MTNNNSLLSGACEAPPGPGPAARGRKYFLHVFGCQMNVNDSLRIGESLAKVGYQATGAAEDADLIILNTCAIREKAEDKMLSALGRYRAVKVRRGALLGVGGCVAQQEKAKLLARVPYLDFVFGDIRIILGVEACPP